MRHGSTAVCILSALWLSPTLTALQSFPVDASYFDVENPTLLDGYPANNETWESLQGKLDSRTHDFDGDGDLDMLIWGNDVAAVQALPGPERAMQILRNETYLAPGVPGTPRMLVVWPDGDTNSPHPFAGIPYPNLKSVYDVAFADFNDDGAVDFVAARLGKKDLVFLRQGTGFVTTFVNPQEESAYALCLGELGDGPSPPYEGPAGTVLHPPVGECTTDGTTPIPELKSYAGLAPCNRRWSIGVSVADLDPVYVDKDGDGDLDYCSFPDIVLAYRASPPRTYKNYGNDLNGDWLGFRVWQEAFPPPPEDVTAGACYPGNGTRDVHFTDLDHDGDLDCVFARSGRLAGGLKEAHVPIIASVLVYQNVGNEFSHWYSLKPPGAHVDLVDCFDTTDPYVYRSASHSITVADVNDDGYDDLIQPVSQLAVQNPDPNGTVTQKDNHPDLRATRIYLNDGSGLLGLTDRRPDTFLGEDVAKTVEAVDLDGLFGPDLYEATSDGNNRPDRIWLSTNVPGQGQLPTYTRVDHFMPEDGFVNDDTRYGRFADLDDDGRLDMIETNFQDGPGPLSRVFWGQDPAVGIASVLKGLPPTSGSAATLTALGTPLASHTIRFVLSNTNAGKAGFLALSYEAGFQLYFGGITAPSATDPNLVIVPITTTGGSQNHLETIPSGTPFGSRLYIQAWIIEDPTGVPVLSSSNALAVTTG